jgi:riboflavin kinase / FMN adenylyltransferase
MASWCLMVRPWSRSRRGLVLDERGAAAHGQTTVTPLRSFMSKRVPLLKPLIVVRDEAPSLARIRGGVVAIGNFDGVHRGHRAVIRAAVERAVMLGRPAVALTFEPHPRRFLRPTQPMFRLSDLNAKLRLLAATGLEGVLLLTFDAALAELSPKDFIARILVGRLAVAGATIGFDFRYGRNREGSPEVLAAEGQRFGFPVEIVPRLEDEGRPVSSSAIREALEAGHVVEAGELLGYPWFVSGRIVHGDKRGRDLGYPTANLRLDPDCGLKHGIYAVRIGIKGRLHDGVASFGRRPTFDDGPPLLEVHVFDFSGELYGTQIDVAFVGWIRSELKFNAVAELIRRMDADARLARAVLARATSVFPPLGPVSQSA